MSATAAGRTGLLRELMRLPPEERLTFLGGIDASGQGLLELGDEVERLAVADVGSAVIAGEAIVELADAGTLPKVRARARRALAQTLAYAGRFADALATCEQAAAVAEAGNEPVEAARARLASLHPLASLGRFDDALAAGHAARESFAGAGECELAARADLNLGAVYAMRDDPASALACFDRAQPLLLDQPGILAQLEANRGNALAALDDYQRAEAAFSSAVAAFEAGGQPLAAAIAEGNRGYLAARQGRLQSALASFERARRLLESSDAPAHRARLLAEQAEVIASLGLPGEALITLQAATPELDRLGLTLEAARARISLSRALIALGRLDEADETLTLAIGALRELGHAGEQARASLLRAGLALHRDDLDRAQELAVEARAVLADRPADRAMATALIAHIALDRNALSEAEAAIAAASADAERLGLSPLIADLAMLRGMVLRARGEPALDAFATAVEETERIRGTLQAARFRSAFHGDRLAPYAELVREALAVGGPNGTSSAFRAAELAKSRALLDVIGGAIDSEGSDSDADGPEAELRSRLERIRAELNWRYSRLALDDLPAGGPSSDRIPTRELERELAVLESRLASTQPAASPSSPPVELDEAIAAIRRNAAAISYTIAGDELLAFVLRDGSCTVHRGLATPDDLSSAIRRFRLQIARAQARAQQGAPTDRLVGDARRELRSLWSMLIGPLWPRIAGAEQLVIAPHGPLHTLPFAALWNGEAHLLEAAEILTIPSLSLFAKLPDGAVHDGRAAAVIGVADELTPSISDEIAQVAAELSGSQLLSGVDATAERVRELLPHVGTAHIACHGRYSREHPHASGLKLADRWLTLSEIAGLRLTGAHVTLSACDTGRASVLAGDELVGLTRGFFAAGARSMIVSLWPVNDSSTAELMRGCYRARRSGKSFPAALRQAQRSLLENTPHPCHWAPFTFGGRS